MEATLATLESLTEANAALRQELEACTTELERSRQLLHYVLEASPAAIFIKDCEGRFLLVNQRAATIIGQPADELVGQADHELFPAEFVARWRAAEHEVIRMGGPGEQEETAPQPDGIHTFLTSRTPLTDAQGTIFALGGVLTDITARVRAEEMLRQTQQRLQLVIDSLPSAVFWKDRDSVYGGCNRVFAQLAGLPSTAAIVGKNDYDMPWGATEADLYRAYDRKVMDAGAPELHIIEPQLTAEGKRIWLDTNKIPLRDEAGTVVGVLGTFEDITAQKQTEEALRTNQTLLQTLFEHLPVAVMLKDATDGRFVLWNGACEQLFGYHADQILGKTDYDLFPREQADGFRAKDRQVLSSGQIAVIPEEFVDSAVFGRRTVQTTKVPILDAQGQPTHLLVICSDLTELQHVINERMALQTQIIEAQQHALHELSTPLLPLSPNVMLLPIIGTMDSRRAQQVLETLLDGVATHRADLAIIDITGVQLVDTQVANAFVQAARAVQLLGAQVMLTGIRPEVAQTLVQLGVDLQGMLTRGSLQAGIAYAFGR